MTDLFHFNLCWLCHAMTAPVKSKEQYYYGARDTYGFILDLLLDKNDSMAPMASYRDDFKLKTIQYYLEKFTRLTGIALRLL